MNNNRLNGYQWNNINKLIERIMLIDFSDIREVRGLRRKLVEEMTNHMDFHVELHTICLEYHDCEEYESRNRFGRKMIRILDETIRELENGESRD